MTQRSIVLGIVSALVGLALSWAWIQYDPLWKAGTSPSERMEVIMKTYSSIFILLGLGFAYKRLQVADRQARTSERGQFTERFSRAVEHLASDELCVRIGGLYALERLTRDAGSFHWPSVEILSAFIKDRSSQILASQRCETVGEAVQQPAPGLKDRRRDQAALPRAPLDIQVAMRIIGRRNPSLDLEGETIDLESALLSGIRLANPCLRGANLSEAHLSGAQMRGGDLSQANLVSVCAIEAELIEVNMRSINFAWSKLTATTLEGSDLQGAGLNNTDLNSCGFHSVKAVGASFRDARVDFCDFTDADLEDTDFSGVDCCNTSGLTAAQIERMNSGPARVRGENGDN